MKVDFRKIHNEKKVAIAVSGGIDSMALVFLAKKFVSTLADGMELVAITVDHGLRPSSTKEAEFVGNVMKKHEIEHYILKWEGEKPEFNVEAIAREKRYELLTDFCKSRGIGCLLVAHHADDQAENFLIRLFRGSGIDGLASMRDVNEMNGVKILRPLLEVTKEELREYLIKHDIKWIEDKSNYDERYLRNKIRGFLDDLDDKNAIVDRINSAVNSIAKAKDVIETELLKEAKEIVKYCDEGYVRLNVSKFCELDEELGLRLLAWCLMEVSGNPYKPRLEKLKRVYDEVVGNKPVKSWTFYGCMLESSDVNGDKNEIFIYREKKAIKNELVSIGGGEFLWDGRFILHAKNGVKFSVETLDSGELKKILEDCGKLKKIKGIDKKILLTIPVIKTKEKVFIPHLNCGDEDLAKKISIYNKFVTKLFK
jgi:tRNA(Ile)-lysidine synthase